MGDTSESHEPGRSLWLDFDLMDCQLLDRGGVSVGRIDDLELTPSDDPDGLPILTGILCGQAALSRRFGRRLGHGVERLRRVVDPVAEPGPGRISFGAVTEIGTEVTVDLDHRSAPTAAVERWLAAEIVGRIPGGRR